MVNLASSYLNAGTVHCFLIVSRLVALSMNKVTIKVGKSRGQSIENFLAGGGRGRINRRLEEKNDPTYSK